MDDLITINTSDGHSLTAKRVHLLANSSVFADMMATSTQGDSVDLVETGEQLKPFIDALGGKLEEFEKLDEEGLEDFARLVDKYGFTLGEELVRKRIWQFIARGQSSLCAFNLSTILHDEELVALMVPKVFVSLAVNSDDLHVSADWKARLELWRPLLRPHAVKAFVLKRLPNLLCQSSNCSRDDSSAWQHLGASLYSVFHIAYPFSQAAPALGTAKRLCSSCRREFQVEAAAFEREYVESAPAIPQL